MHDQAALLAPRKFLFKFLSDIVVVLPEGDFGDFSRYIHIYCIYKFLSVVINEKLLLELACWHRENLSFIFLSSRCDRVPLDSNSLRTDGSRYFKSLPFATEGGPLHTGCNCHSYLIANSRRDVEIGLGRGGEGRREGRGRRWNE